MAGAGASIGRAVGAPIAVATNKGSANGAVTVQFERGAGNVVDYVGVCARVCASACVRGTVLLAVSVCVCRIVVIKEELSRGQRIAGWELDIQLGQPDGQKPWRTVAVGSTIGASRIIPLGMPGKGQFIPGELCQAGFSHCHGAIGDAFGVRLRPTISVADDGIVYIAELSAFDSKKSAPNY